jgi:hypothetical protein
VQSIFGDATGTKVSEAHDGWPILSLWNEYERIAMHFNDLLIRIRTQALAGVAAISAFTGLFAKADLGVSWEVAGMVFTGLAAFWIAVWVIDFCYYNKLLVGAIAALLILEKRSKTHKTIDAIQMSTLVEDSVKNGIDFELTCRQKFKIVAGRWLFYSIVMLALVVGAFICFWIFYHHSN